jgi:hypothetical protein
VTGEVYDAEGCSYLYNMDGHVSGDADPQDTQVINQSMLWRDTEIML